MQGDVYAVDWNIQGDGVGSIGNAETALDSELGQINTDGNNLRSNWDSTARTAYDSRQKAWDDAGTAIKDALGKFKLNLGASAEIAQGAENKNKGIMGA